MNKKTYTVDGVEEYFDTLEEAKSVRKSRGWTRGNRPVIYSAEYLGDGEFTNFEPTRY